MRTIQLLLLSFVLFLIIPKLTYADTWENLYSGETNEYSYCAVETTDDGFVILGKTNSFGSGNYDLLLLKIDPKGNKRAQEP